MKTLLSVLSVSALLLASCSSKSDTTGTNNNNNNNTSGTSSLTATVNGTNMTFKIDTLSTQFTSNNVPGFGTYTTVTTTSIDAVSGISFAIAYGGYNVSSGTSYDIGLDATPTVPGMAMTYQKPGGSGSLSYGTSATKNTSVGKFKVTSLSSTNMQVNFNATLHSETGATGTDSIVTITNGVFNIYHHN